MTVVGWCLLFPWWIVWLHGHRIERLRIRVLFTSIVVGAVLLYGVYEWLAFEQRRQHYVMVQEIVPLRIGPGQQYGRCALLPRGARVIVKKVEGDWVYAETAHAVGWLPAAAVGVVV